MLVTLSLVRFNNQSSCQEAAEWQGPNTIKLVYPHLDYMFKVLSVKLLRLF